jgi:hypothetical protein
MKAPKPGKKERSDRSHKSRPMIGYSASFPLLIKTQFPENLALVFCAPLGPVLGSLVRPLEPV